MRLNPIIDLIFPCESTASRLSNHRFYRVFEHTTVRPRPLRSPSLPYVLSTGLYPYLLDMCRR